MDSQNKSIQSLGGMTTQALESKVLYFKNFPTKFLEI